MTTHALIVFKTRKRPMQVVVEDDVFRGMIDDFKFHPNVAHLDFENSFGDRVVILKSEVVAIREK